MTSLLPQRQRLKHFTRRLAKYQSLPELDSATKLKWIRLKRILDAWLTASLYPVLVFRIDGMT